LCGPCRAQCLFLHGADRRRHAQLVAKPQRPNLNGDDSHLDDKHLRDMAGTCSRRFNAFCARQGIAIIGAGTRERKHELAEPHVPKDPTFGGLFVVITGNALAPSGAMQAAAAVVSKASCLRRSPGRPCQPASCFGSVTLPQGDELLQQLRVAHSCVRCRPCEVLVAGDLRVWIGLEQVESSKFIEAVIQSRIAA